MTAQHFPSCGSVTSCDRYRIRLPKMSKCLFKIQQMDPMSVNKDAHRGQCQVVNGTSVSQDNRDGRPVFGFLELLDGCEILF